MLLYLCSSLSFFIGLAASRSISISPDPRFQSDFHAGDTVNISWSGITAEPIGPDASWQCDLWVTTFLGDAYNERIQQNVPVSEDGFLQWQISSVMNKYNTTGNGFLLRLRDHHASDDKYLNGTAPTWTFNSERFFLKKSETSVENSSTTTSQTISSQTTSSQTTLQTTVSSTTPSAVVSSSATQASQTPPSLATEKSSSANNAGAIAAGVLGGLLGLALICGAILLLLRRKRGRNNSEDKVALPKSVNAEKAELGRSGSDSDITELDARDRVELDAYGRKPFELGAVSQAAELSADGKPTLYKSDGGRFVGCLRPSL